VIPKSLRAMLPLLLTVLVHTMDEEREYKTINQKRDQLSNKASKEDLIQM
jgi:hypothetical protein